MDPQVFPPSRLADHPWGMGDLHDHQEKMLPHAAGGLPALLGRPVGKRLSEIIANHAATDPQPIGQQVGR